MAPRKKELPLSFDTLARLGAEFQIPVLAGMDLEAVSELPPHTIFACVTDQHWILAIKGEHKTIVFDSLGLPISTLSRICKGIPIEPWNRFGYQSMWGTVCGYYVAAALIFMQHGNLQNNGDIDRLFKSICPVHVGRPDTISDWYHYHRQLDSKLKQNDERVVAFVLSTYPNLAWIDRHAPHISSGEVHSGAVGSPIYARAGIHAPTVYERFHQVNQILTNDAQKAWPGGIGNQLISTAPEQLGIVSGQAIAYRTKRAKELERARARQELEQEGREHLNNPARFAHVAGPAPHRRMTHNERILWGRAGLNGFNPPSGPTAAGNDRGVQPDAAPENEQARNA